MAGQWEGLHVRPLATKYPQFLQFSSLPPLRRLHLHNGRYRRVGCLTWAPQMVTQFEDGPAPMF